MACPGTAGPLRPRSACPRRSRSRNRTRRPQNIRPPRRLLPRDRLRRTPPAAGVPPAAPTYAPPRRRRPPRHLHPGTRSGGAAAARRVQPASAGLRLHPDLRPAASADGPGPRLPPAHDFGADGPAALAALRRGCAGNRGSALGISEPRTRADVLGQRPTPGLQRLRRRGVATFQRHRRSRGYLGRPRFPGSTARRWRAASSE